MQIEKKELEKQLTGEQETSEAADEEKSMWRIDWTNKNRTISSREGDARTEKYPKLLNCKKFEKPTFSLYCYSLKLFIQRLRTVRQKSERKGKTYAMHSFTNEKKTIYESIWNICYSFYLVSL